MSDEEIQRGIEHLLGHVEKFLRQRGASREDAEDLAMETMVSIIRRGFHAELPLPALERYAIRVAWSRVNDHRRERRHIVTLDKSLEAEDPRAPSPEELVYEHEITAALDKALGQLEPLDRKLVLSLFASPPARPTELARRLSLPTKAISRRLAYSLAALSKSVVAAIGPHPAPLWPGGFVNALSRLIPEIRSWDDPFDALEYYGAHRSEIDLLGDNRAMFLLLLIHRLGPLSRSDMSRHTGWEDEIVVEVLDRLASAGAVSPERDVELLGLREVGQRVLDILLT